MSIPFLDSADPSCLGEKEVQPLSNVQIINYRHSFTNWPKLIPFAAMAFISLLNGNLDIKS